MKHGDLNHYKMSMIRREVRFVRGFFPIPRTFTMSRSISNYSEDEEDYPELPRIRHHGGRMDNGTRNARPEVTEASVALAKANEVNVIYVLCLSELTRFKALRRSQLKEQELQERIRQMQEQEHVQRNSCGRRQPGRGNTDSEVDEAGVKVRSVYWRAADFGRKYTLLCYPWVERSWISTLTSERPDVDLEDPSEQAADPILVRQVQAWDYLSTDPEILSLLGKAIDITDGVRRKYLSSVSHAHQS